MNQEQPQRTCGNCKVCCTALKVDDLPKDEWLRCQHLGSLGCKIYRSRPLSCVTYKCAWLQGLGGRNERPDRLGVIFSPVHSDDLGDHVIVHEIKPGAFNTPVVQKIVSLVAGQAVVFFIRRDSMRQLVGGPKDRLVQIVDRARERGLIQIDGHPLTPDITTEQFLAGLPRRSTGAP